MEYRIIEGEIDGLQRSNHVSGGRGETSASTTHIAMFQLGAERVVSQSSTFFPFADGDKLKVVGREEGGQFYLLAAKNYTTDWMSPKSKRPAIMGCFLAFFVFALCVMTLMSGGLLLPVTGLMGFMLYKFVSKYNTALKDSQRAREILLREL